MKEDNKKAMKKEIIMYKYLVFTGLLSLTVACTPKNTSESVPEVNSEQTVESINSTEFSEVHDKETQNAISKLQWVQEFNLRQEIDRALREKDFRLLVVAKRGPNVPGVDLKKQASLKKVCGEKYLEGVGGVQFGEVHKKLYDRAIQLASKYNMIVADNCEKLTSQK